MRKQFDYAVLCIMYIKLVISTYSVDQDVYKTTFSTLLGAYVSLLLYYLLWLLQPRERQEELLLRSPHILAFSRLWSQIKLRLICCIGVKMFGKCYNDSGV